MLAEHLQVGVLAELAGRAGRKQWRAVRFPCVADRVSSGNSLEVVLLGVGRKIGAYEITGTKLSDFEVAGCRLRKVEERFRELPVSELLGASTTP